MRADARCLVLSFAALVAACGGDGAREARVDASGDGGRGDGGAPDATAGKPCNGACTGVCRGVCAGICSERDELGECHSACSGVCVGACDGTCAKLVRWDASFASASDARPDAVRGDASADGPRDAGVSDAPVASGWLDRTHASSLSWPPAAHAGAVAFDARRARLVMFGGAAGEPGNATWEWDGTTGTWLQRQQLGGARPPARWGHALVYDPDGGRVILYGGVDAAGASLSDVWAWDGSAESWTPRATGPRPSRWGHAMTYDVARKRVVVFGGSYRHASLGDGDLFDTWEYDAAADAWSNRTFPLPATWPRPRRGHALVYDEARAVSVLYGGEIADAPGAAMDLWEYDGATGTWAERSSASGPGARTFAGFAPIGGGRLVLFGNLPPNLWQWTGANATWQPLGAGGTPWPLPRARPLLAWDAARRVLVLTGGSVAVGRATLVDTWEWAAP